MISKKEIENFIKHYCKETFADKDEEIELISEGIKEGVYFGVKQFLKELWHNAKEEPDINKHIILEHLKDGYVDSYNSIMWRGKISWSDFLEDHDFISRWFYIDDLL